jgi:hypothetical protein
MVTGAFEALLIHLAFRSSSAVRRYEMLVGDMQNVE